jgi:uracil-DNA glycosylase
VGLTDAAYPRTTVRSVVANLLDQLPVAWRRAMSPYLDADLVAQLSEFVAKEYAAGEVYPPAEDLFAAFRLCSLADARVLILGQDPYHRPGQAHGLSFSVRPGVAVPPSLRNVFKELADDLGVAAGPGGCLNGWAEQGVLLLNAVLTVRAGKPASHARRNWEHVTDAAIQALNAKPERVVFLLWGTYARQKAALVTGAQHVVLEAGHPSPMNPRGFLGSRPFSQTNAALVAAGRPPVDWARR